MTFSCTTLLRGHSLKFEALCNLQRVHLNVEDVIVHAYEERQVAPDEASR